MNQQIHDRLVDASATTGVGGGILFGQTIGQINEYLQAGAYVVAIISGLCAAVYYVRKARRLR